MTVHTPDSRKLYPLFVYLYDSHGYYTEPIRVAGRPSLEVLFKTMIADSIKENREVRITDVDDFLVFHAFKGHIKWDGVKAHVCSECVQSDD